jgi:Kef-type K+ transport system membrane component KefB
MPDLALLLLQIAVILGLSRLAVPLFAKLAQPAVIAEMTVGLLLGPSLFGWIAPDLWSRLFPPSSLPALGVLSQVGLVAFMFVIGWRLDIGHLTTIGARAFVTGLVSIVVPFALGFGVAVVAWAGHAPPGVGLVPFALFMGAAMSITAFPVLARILMAHGLLESRIGTLALACAAFNDVAGWLILAAITAVVRAGGLGDAGQALIGLAIYGTVMVGIVRPLLARVGRARRDRSGTKTEDLAIVLVIMLLSAFTTEVLGVHALFGAFFAGVVMPRDEQARRVFTEAIEPLTTSLLLPLFFAFSGLRTSVDMISGAALWDDAALILLVAVVGKGVSSSLTVRAQGTPWIEALAIGILLNTRGLVELVVLNIGLDLGILSPVLFSMMVLMAFVTTLATSPLLWWLRRRPEFAALSSPR